MGLCLMCSPDMQNGRSVLPKHRVAAVAACLRSLFGMSCNELLQGLRQQLPQLNAQMTPHGRVPTKQEAVPLL
jgi:uncharacterized protein YidB (DUF937 family)